MKAAKLGWAEGRAGQEPGWSMAGAGREQGRSILVGQKQGKIRTGATQGKSTAGAG